MGELDDVRSTQPGPEAAGSASLTGRQIGRYLVGQQLGSGGVAEVYQAYDQVLGKSVALKLLPIHADERTLSRFRREALTAGALRHPHIVRILQVGGAQPDGVAYMAMELVQGESLAALLSRCGRLHPAESCNLLEPIARALAHAHHAGVVHRDVKPGNILLQPASPGAPNSVQLESLDHPVVPLLTDFGIARSLDSPELTSAGRTVGTPAYMAPEQCAGSSEIDGRADIYALGVVLYRCVAGRLPFNGSTTQILHAHVYEPLVIEDQVLRQLSPIMVDILKQSMAKRPQDRYADADRLAADLALAAGRRQSSGHGDTGEPADHDSATATLTMGSLPAAGNPTTASTTVLVRPASPAQARTSTGRRPDSATAQAPPARALRSRRRLSLVLAAGVVAALAVVLVGFFMVIPLADRVGRRDLTPTSAAMGLAGPSQAELSPQAILPSNSAGPTHPASAPTAIAGAATSTAAAIASAPSPIAATPVPTWTPSPSPTVTWTPIPTPTTAPTPVPTPQPTATPLPPAGPASGSADDPLVTTCANTIHDFFVGFISQLGESQRASFACPGGTAAQTSGTYLPFERGYMVQLAASPLILVYYADAGEWEQLVEPGEVDLGELGDSSSSSAELFTPNGAFGRVWQDEQRKAALGYATRPDPVSFDAIQQTFPGGLLIGNLGDGAVYAFLRDRLRL